MSFSQKRLIALACIVVHQFVAQAASAQSRTVLLNIDQTPQVMGGHSYDLEIVQLIPLLEVPIHGSIAIAPDGTEFESLFERVQRTSFSALGATLFGDWTVTETPNVGSPRSYTFRVEPFTLDDVIVETPVITSPNDGATVPPDFVVKWEFPSGELYSGRGFTVHGLSNVNLSGGTVGVDGYYSRSVETELLGAGPGQITLSVNTQSHFVNNPRNISRDPALIGQRINLNMSFASRSLPITLQIVPEPRSITLGGLSIVLLACASTVRGHRFRRRTARISVST